MIEQVYHYTKTENRCIEKLIDDDVAAINHVVLPCLDSVPEHETNSNVYLIIQSGVMSAVFNDQVAKAYPAGTILFVPYKTHMKISNQTQGDVLEFFILKTPSPRLME